MGDDFFISFAPQRQQFLLAPIDENLAMYV